MKTNSPTRAPKGRGIRKVLHAIAEATGVGPIARAAIEAENGIIDRLVAKARKHHVSETRIRGALAAKRKLDRAMSMIALLYPFLPNPALLRLAAGPKPKRTKPSARPRPRPRRMLSEETETRYT